MSIFSFLNRKEILPEVLNACKWRFPDTVEVLLKESEDGGYIAYVKDLEGCVTQAETGQELFEMVNDAICSYFQVPNEYRVYMPTFFPSEELRQELGIKIPAEFLGKDVVLQKT